MTDDTKRLFVIADGAHARFVRVDPGGVLHTIASMDSAAAHKRTSDLGSDHPGASFHSDSSAHHALRPRHDLHADAERDFAHLVAGEVQAVFSRGDFDQLVLAALPPTINAIREKLGPVAAAIVGTVAKDLVKQPDDAVALHLRPWLPT